MAYNERIKNFEKVRAYLREFYIYGFKSRNEYNAKSARSYDDERRRMESWLGDYMCFTQTSEGKNVFLSIDSRITHKNPFYKVWKAKSFTDGDITLHFAIFDILYNSDIKMTINELIESIDELICGRISFDESTIRKKLKEYAKEGIICITKQGRKVYYSRSCDIDIIPLMDIINFFSEVAPCGVIGSFLQDKFSKNDEIFSFKHHYITQAMDSEIMEMLFEAMQEHRYITVDNLGKHTNKVKTVRLVPLKIYISVQNGKQNLIAYHETANRMNSYRLDYITNVCIEDEICENFDELRNDLSKAEKYMWGVNCKRNINHIEHVEFEIKVEDDEQYIIRRLEREKRCGRVEKIDECHYRYVADVYDTQEMLPWIRTFIARITKISFSNHDAENQFKKDIQEMYKMYDIEEGDTHVI